MNLPCIPIANEGEARDPYNVGEAAHLVSIYEKGRSDGVITILSILGNRVIDGHFGFLTGFEVHAF